MTRRLTAWAAALAAVVLTATGCSAGAGNNGSGGEEKRTDMVVAHTAERHSGKRPV